jgi:hypothetical protein
VIRLSQTAWAQVSRLAEYYAERGRPDSVRELRPIIGNAGERIEAGRGLFFPSPRPYPGLTRPGWSWLKVGSYWIAFATDEDGAVIQAIF